MPSLIAILFAFICQNNSASRCHSVAVNRGSTIWEFPAIWERVMFPGGGFRQICADIATVKGPLMLLCFSIGSPSRLTHSKQSPEPLNSKFGYTNVPDILSMTWFSLQPQSDRHRPHGSGTGWRAISTVATISEQSDGFNPIHNLFSTNLRGWPNREIFVCSVCLVYILSKNVLSFSYCNRLDQVSCNGRLVIE